MTDNNSLDTKKNRCVAITSTSWGNQELLLWLNLGGGGVVAYMGYILVCAAQRVWLFRCFGHK